MLTDLLRAGGCADDGEGGAGREVRAPASACLG